MDEINNRENKSKKLNKYITTLDYADKTLLVSSAASSGVSLCLFTTAIGTPGVIASVSISLVFLISIWIVEIFLETVRRGKISIKRLLY